MWYNYIAMPVKRKSRVVFVIAAVVFLTCPAYSLDAPEEMLEKINRRYRNVLTLRAEFVQQEKIATMGGIRKSQGILFMKRPGKMRWDYTMPDNQAVVTDGRTLWMYYPDEKTVYQLKLTGEDLKRTPLAVIFQEDRSLQEFFRARSLSRYQNDLILLELESLQETQEMSSVALIVHPDTGSLRGTVIKDAFGNRTEILLDKPDEEVAIDDDIFRFEIPPGTKILTGRDQSL